MKARVLPVVLLLCATAAVPAQANPGLAKTYGCDGCHLPDRAVIGPSWQQISQRYAGQKDAAAKLQAKVRAGGSGAWGKNFPMPPNPNVPDADLKRLVDWALAGGK
ncbi:c-type cytochrome [Uliginosibacterium sp. H1]|uniref:c-type cytochrome n=1 Tax=Uliginosibacterium sp. H1 TaxID=3114757 RepID=UPI002E173A64|nr:c-type cytochrome [Uliginosibacterium sp. H1]